MSCNAKSIVWVVISLSIFPHYGNSTTDPEPSSPKADFESNEPPLGIWFWRANDFDTQRKVSITKHQNTWTAKVDGNNFAAEDKGQSFEFSLPNGERFSGKLSDNTLNGNWFQPESQYAYSAMATQVSLTQVSKNKWSGTVNIQPRPFHLFLDIFEDNSGKIKAVIRNPERNDILGATIFDLIQVPDTTIKKKWQLVAQRRGREITIPLSYSNHNSLQFKHNLIDEPVRLIRAKHTDLNNYYSRPKDARKHALTPVSDLDDGWNVADPSDAGFDAQLLGEALSNIAKADPRSRSPQLVHSLLVSYKSELVMEEYFYGHHRDEVHDTRSLSKVFGSVMIGAAQQKGFDISPSYTPLPKVFQQYNLAVPENKAELTLEDFMTYTSGLDTREDSDSKGSEDRLWSQRNEEFWLYSAKLPVLYPPGNRYAYSSASANMVGAALEQVTHTSVREFFHKALAKPLQFSTYHWNLTPQGTSYLGGGVYMRPRDILKIGALYAANGKWKGKQIIPQDWVKHSTTSKIEVTPKTTGLSEEEFSNNYFGGGQAYIWFVNDIMVGKKAYRSFGASGNGGQMIIVVPELELAVGFTGGNYRMGSVWGKWRQQIVGEYIIPALTKPV